MNPKSFRTRQQRKSRWVANGNVKVYFQGDIMRIKFRSLWMLVLLCLCCFLAACARETISEQITESTAAQEETAESAEIPATTEPTDYVPEMSGKIDFRYIYRGFTGV